MSEQITVKFINDSGSSLTILEKTCNEYASWHDTPSSTTQILKMQGRNETYGLLRFESPAGTSSTGTPKTDRFIIAIGYVNGKGWCDIIVDLEDAQTATKLHASYLVKETSGGSLMGRWDVLKANLNEMSKKTAKGRTVGVFFYKREGSGLAVVVTYA